jgi:acylphosphatase
VSGARAEPADETSRVRACVVVRGRVQGVWFRDSCRSQATALGLGGWVRNLADGSVEAVFEGPRAAVQRAVDWCRTGPDRARVDGVDVTWDTPTGEVDFKVL